jgi:hypothetical protein
MSTTESYAADVRYFGLIAEHFVAPVFFFLSLVMLAETIYCLAHAGHQPKNLVLGCLSFMLGYNAFRIGKGLAGEIEVFYIESIFRPVTRKFRLRI